MSEETPMGDPPKMKKTFPKMVPRGDSRSAWLEERTEAERDEEAQSEDEAKRGDCITSADVDALMASAQAAAEKAQGSGYSQEFHHRVQLVVAALLSRSTGRCAWLSSGMSFAPSWKFHRT